MKPLRSSGASWASSRQRPHRRAERAASLRRPEPAVRRRRHGAVRARTSSASRTPPWPRATSIQKCIRTQDIEEVGKTTRHGTFFQMNGNFSFGDYFKDGAIQLAWELSTKSHRRRRLRAGRRQASGPRSTSTTTRRSTSGTRRSACRWSASSAAARPTTSGRWASPARAGRAASSTYDRGPDYGREGGPEVDEDRYMEFWNLVFMQNERGPGVRSKDDFPILGELPKKNIDTGMGMERMAALLQGVDNLYEIDQTRPDPRPRRRTDRQGVRRALRARGQRVAPRRRAAARHRRPRAHRR